MVSCALTVQRVTPTVCCYVAAWYSAWMSLSMVLLYWAIAAEQLYIRVSIRLTGQPCGPCTWTQDSCDIARADTCW